MYSKYRVNKLPARTAFLWMERVFQMEIDADNMELIEAIIRRNYDRVLERTEREIPSIPRKQKPSNTNETFDRGIFEVSPSVALIEDELSIESSAGQFGIYEYITTALAEPTTTPARRARINDVLREDIPISMISDALSAWFQVGIRACQDNGDFRMLSVLLTSFHHLLANENCDLRENVTEFVDTLQMVVIGESAIINLDENEEHVRMGDFAIRDEAIELIEVIRQVYYAVITPATRKSICDKYADCLKQSTTHVGALYGAAGGLIAMNALKNFVSVDDVKDHLEVIEEYLDNQNCETIRDLWFRFQKIKDELEDCESN